MRLAAALLAALLVVPGALPAQRIAAFEPVRAPLLLPSAPQESPTAVAPSNGRLLAGSALGASVGALAGWMAGALIVFAGHGQTNNLNDAFSTLALAALAGSAGAVVLGGVGSRIGVKAAGGAGGPLGNHILASLAGWGASLFLFDALYSGGNNPESGTAFVVLMGSHGLVTALLAPKRQA